MSKEATQVSAIFFTRLEELYCRLRGEAREVWVAEKIRLERAIREASFKTFATALDYESNDRARQFSWRVSNRLGRDVFRVYFNDFSRKVYVDLNAPRTTPMIGSPDGVVELGTEILRSIMFTDPNLLDEEVPTEIVIVPPQG